ncbi:MAG: tetratricopeptide repeat protein [Rikenella sp.]|nr:tetratricopeptide repeat protein [Rikenella sp.]
MRKFLNISLAVLAASALLSSCTCFSKMMKKTAQGITVTSAPELVTLKGDNAVTTVTVNIPAKVFHRFGVLKVTPTIVSAIDGTEYAGEPHFFQGEKVQDNYTVVPYSGGTFSMNVSIAYDPNMRLSQLVLKVEAKCVKNGNKIKNFTAYNTPVLVANGVNTLQLMADNYAKVAIAPDAFQRVTNISESAKIMFVINQSNVRSNQLAKEDIKALEDFIVANSGDAKKTVGDVYTQAYASPDGPLSLNDRLSKERGAATEKAVSAKFKKDKMPVGTKFDVNAMGEDWEGFKELVEASDIQDKALILQVLSMYSDPQVRDREIKNMSAAFQVLADKILPELRRSKMTVNVRVEGLTDAELKEAVATDINKLNVEEMLFAATLYTDNATKARIYKAAADKYNCYRGYNNLGVVLANSGDYAGAKAAFLKAASLNNTDPNVLNNLGVVALADGNKVEAAKFFAASSAPEAKYNKGLVELANGNYAAAAKTLDGYNQALAELLNGNVAKAKQQLAGMNTWSANYVKAVIAAQEGNADALVSNLKAAVAQNPQAAELAATEVNFYNFFEHAQFVEVVKVKYKMKY